MATAYFSHPTCAMHDMGAAHFDSPGRVKIIESNLKGDNLLKLMHCYKALPASKDHLLLAHDADYIDSLIEFNQRRVDTLIALSPEATKEPITFYSDLGLNEYSMQAAELSAGSVIQSVDLTMARCADNVFCVTRPPGHNAGRSFSKDGCIINNVMVGAKYAKLVYRLKRIAIVDFDASFGFGTQDIMKDDENFLYISIFQHRQNEKDLFQKKYDNVKRFPMMKRYDGERYRTIFNNYVLPTLREYNPQLLFISAGFNAHASDLTSNLKLTDADYYWMTESLLAEDCLEESCSVISVLEGGYNLKALSKSVNQHIRALLGSPEKLYPSKPIRPVENLHASQHKAFHP